MIQPLDHELKLLRAHHHLEQLQTKVTEWLTHDRYSIMLEPDPTDPEYRLLKVTGAEKPPIDPFGLIIGDCVQNMRHSLDHLALALARTHTVPLPKDFEKTSQFPIFGDEDRQGNSGVGAARFYSTGRGGGLRLIRGIDPNAQAIIERLQPYNRGHQYRSHSLWVLGQLSNFDKHRLVHPVIGYFPGFIFTQRDDTNYVFGKKGVLQSFSGILEKEAIVARIPVSPADPTREMKMDLELPVEIAFNKTSPVASGEPVVGTLTTIYNYIRDVVLPRLEPFL